MDNPQEGRTVYQHWLEAVAGVVTQEIELFETHCQGSLKIMEAALRCPEGGPAGPDKPADAGAPPMDEFQKLEAVALERAQKGFAPPKEIYGLPYRSRVAWDKFPDWARPIDPDVFEGAGHEG
jgi:hypothetical protein